MYGRDRARYESCLAVAHRNIYRAIECAQHMGDFGAEEDLHQILKEIHRVAEASLKGNIKVVRTLPGQTRLHGL